MYKPTKWLDHVTDEATGEIIQEGTNQSAGNFNKMERGITDGAVAQAISLIAAERLGDEVKGKKSPRAARFVVGTATNGWTLNDCDFLCDGTADDVEINAAIKALPEGGGEIVILDGTYALQRTVTIAKAGVTIVGNGLGTKLTASEGGSMSSGMILVRADDCTIESLCFNGENLSPTAVIPASCIRVNPVEVARLKIRNNVFENARGAISLNNLGVVDSEIVGNRILNSTDYGMEVRGDYCLIAGNTVDNCAKDGIRIVGPGNIVANNTVRYSDGAGISADMAVTNDLVISGNILRENLNGLYLSCSIIAVVGNHIRGNTNDGILCEGLSSCAITGNVFALNGNAGINGTRLSSSTISGNMIHANTHSVYLANDSYNKDNLITGNILSPGSVVDNSGQSNTIQNNLAR